MIFSDETNERKLRSLLRKLRHFNYIPSRIKEEATNFPIKNIVEDPIMRDSKESYFVQLADAVAYALYRKAFPVKRYRRFNVEKLFDIIDPLFNKKASPEDPWKQGVV